MKGDFTRFTFDRRKHYSGIRMQQGRVQLDSDWNELGDIQAYRMRTESEDFIGPSGTPRLHEGFAIRVAPDETNLTISPGRMYVDGILCENEEEILVTEQPDLPGFELPDTDGLYLAYLEVWHRHITALEAPSLREVGLGGADTATRIKTVWQVKLHRVGEVGMEAKAESDFPGWSSAIAPGTGALRARVRGGVSAQLRTGLYRVEIHRIHPETGKLSLKWARDNVSTVAHWRGQSGAELALESLGRTGALGIAPGHWVELTDDSRELWQRRGTFVHVVQVEGNVVTVDPESATDSIAIRDFPLNPKVCRWDSAGVIEVKPDDEWIPLEDDLEVQLVAGPFRPGDYWLIPSRSFSGDVEWPRDGTDPLAQPPHGIARHHSRLALLELKDGAFGLPEDCRFIFLSLTDLKNIHAVRSAINAPIASVYIDGAGNVGIGTKEPTVRLEVHGEVVSVAHGTRFSMVPVGAVLPFAAEVAPEGWLECDGRAASRMEYADLFAVIGVRYGKGDGTATFNLPDLRGTFVRGWDHERGIDSGRELGDLQNHQFGQHAHIAKAIDTHDHGFGKVGNHSHNFKTDGNHQHNTGEEGHPTDYIGAGYICGYTAHRIGGETQWTSFAGSHSHGFRAEGEHDHGFRADGAHTHEIEPAGGAETRPVNISLLFCIKY